jgi:uncharacterized protein (UPF0548 family)
MPFLVGKASDDRLEAVLRRARQQEPSYGAVGATGTGAGADIEPPAGYRMDRHSVDVPADAGAFERVAEGLRHWEAHRRAGAPVFPASAPLRAGETVVVTLRLAPLVTMAAPCRVIYVTDETDRFGFGYGTLPGHPEDGEEAFHVVRTPGGVRLEIDAFSRPRHPLVRLGRPVARSIQRAVTKRYLASLRSLAGGEGAATL